MARQVSKGTCTFCHRELSKSGVAKHLQSCQQRIAGETKAQGHQKAQQTRVFHLIVQGIYAPMYWIHLEVTAETTLAALDRFLRDIWLECCDHLSQFKIGNVRYCENSEMYASWSMGRKDMDVRLDEVLSPGQTCSYEYDFGSTTELTLKVILEREVQAKEKAIQVLARNSLPLVPPMWRAFHNSDNQNLKPFNDIRLQSPAKHTQYKRIFALTKQTVCLDEEHRSYNFASS